MSESDNPIVEAIEAEATRRQRARSVRPIRGLIPFVTRYKGMVAAAFGALVLATTSTLVFPVAARRMMDEGFSSANAEFIDRYFLALIGVAAVLGIASA